MKKGLVIFIFVISIMTSLLLLSSKDDDLNIVAIDFLGRLNAEGDGDSFLFLHGIFAPETEDPIEFGKKLIIESRKVNDDSVRNMFYDNPRNILYPEGYGFSHCVVWDEDCIETLFTSEVDIEKLLDKNKVLITRSNEFLSFNDYATLITPNFFYELGHYSYIVSAERINVLSAITLYNNGEAEQAVESLLLQFSKLRKAFVLQETFIGKEIILLKLNEIIDVCSVMLYQGDIVIEEIPRLTEAEKDLHKVVATEFSVLFHMFKELDKHPEFFGKIPGWAIKRFYKPFMTINATTPIYSEIESLAVLSPPEFINEIENRKKNVLRNSMFRNYIGWKILNKTNRNLIYSTDSFIASVIDFDIKLKLFNHKYFLGKPLNTMKNPYYEGEIGEEKNGSFCFKGPFKDNKHFRCLKIKI